MSFFGGEACPDDNLKGILSIHLKLGKYIHSIKIWKSLDFGIDWSRNGQMAAILNFRNAQNGGHFEFSKFSQKLQKTKMLISQKPC